MEHGFRIGQPVQWQAHECVDIAVDYGISGQYVTRLLDQAATFRGYPLAVRTDNGPEFTSRAFMVSLFGIKEPAVFGT